MGDLMTNMYYDQCTEYDIPALHIIRKESSEKGKEKMHATDTHTHLFDFSSCQRFFITVIRHEFSFN